MNTRVSLKSFFDEEYTRDVENLKSGLKPPAALSAESKIALVLSILNVPLDGLSLAWTFRSKGIRYFEQDGSVLLTGTGKALTIGRRCAMYVRLPCAVPSVGLSAGDYLGVVGDVSTQSTNVSTVVYFLVVPRTEKIWAIVGVLDAAHGRVDLTREAIKRSMEVALNRSLRLKENRALARQRNTMASSAPVSRNIRKRVEKSVPAVAQSAPEPVVREEFVRPSEYVNSNLVVVAASAPNTGAEEQKSDFQSEEEAAAVPPVVENVQDTQNEFVFSPAETYDCSDVFAQQADDYVDPCNWFDGFSPVEESSPSMEVFGCPEEYW